MGTTDNETSRLSITVLPDHKPIEDIDRREIRKKALPQCLLFSLTLCCILHIAVSQHAATSQHMCRKTDIFFNSSLCARHEGGVRDTDKAGDREDKKIKIAEEEDDDVDIDPDIQPAFESQPPQHNPAQHTPPSSCGSCRPREELRRHSIEAIKSEILSKLGMTQAPNLKGRFRPEHGVNLLVARYKTEEKSRNTYQLRRHSGGHHPQQQGLHWVLPDDEMQGDAPSDSNGAGRGNSKDYGDKVNYIRSHVNSSDSRYSEPYHEGEPVYMDEEDDYHVRTKKIVAFSLPHPRIRHMPELQYFRFSDKAQTNKVKKAVLWVYIRGKESPLGASGDSINITVYRLHRSQQGRSTDSPILVPVIGRITQPIPNGPGAWINLEYGELEKIVAEWFRAPQQNTGLIINATDRHGTNLAVTTQHHSLNISAVPFLEVYLSDTKKHRTKRTLGLNCNDSSNETRCCRYPLTVNFEEFGWDWIIAPKTYEANFCDGECPMVFMQQYPHTHLSQLSTASAPKGRSGPCCAPRKLSPISMLYFDMNMNIVYGTLPAMVVDRCGCM